MQQSISRSFLTRLVAISVVCTALTSVVAFVCFEHELEVRQVQFLSQYVQERTDNVDRKFSELTTLQHSAASALERSVSDLKAADAQAFLKQHTILLPDGTRRSRAAEFDGIRDKEGGLTYGIGAYLSQAGHLDPQQTALLAAAFPIVARFGQAAHGSYDTFYFFTPQTRVIMFGPDRPDRLMFYRRNAPADLDISHEEMARIVRPDLDPLRETRCTSLQRLVQDKKDAQRVATACITPVYVRGRFVGAFGSSLDLKTFFAKVLVDPYPSAETMIVRNDGQLLAAPRAPMAAVRNEAAVARYEHELDLAKLVRDLDGRGQTFGVVRAAVSHDIVAYGRLEGPGWYLMVRYPAAALLRSAALSASWILLLGLVGASVQTIILLRLARVIIIQPLRALAQSCESEDSGGAMALSGRQDEIGVLANSLDNQRARSSELLESLEERVRQRTAELERANEEKSRFLANMSHELRTPLNGIVALSETLAGNQTTPRDREIAGLIVGSGRMLERVLTDILDFSKIEAGEMRLELHPFDLVAVVRGVAELHRASAEAKDLDFQWSVADEVRGSYVGDAVRLSQVLSNLLSNAVKFTDQGRVILTVCSAAAGGVRFEVADTGIGFDQSVREILFKRFEQADPSIRRRFGGTGLGLSICQSLVGQMGGAIDAVSTPGKGSAFTFEIPLQPDASATGDLHAIADADAPRGPMRVLLAEDHPTNQRVVQLILDAAGIELTIVDDGLQALEALERQTFDVVLMDMQMPELDGLGATDLWRCRERAQSLPRTPIIMLTANALDEHRRASQEAGADRHLSKPIRAAELLAAMAEVVTERDRVQPSGPYLAAAADF